MADLSILVPARSEEFLSRTVEGILKNIRGNTEILVGLDGEWSDPPLEDDPRVTILYHNESVGQRAMLNELCRLSKAKWVMKIDAHCIVDEGFDIKMMEALKGHDDWTGIPALYNLYAFDWRCKKCGNRWYQSPIPTHCQMPAEQRRDNPNCDNTTDFERIMVWQPRWSRRQECYCFDTTLHFQYHGEWKKHAEGDIVETMSAQGSCFMLTREKWWELNICDEEHGSWGQQGTEVACKTWLSGGRLITVRNTWYSHLFRTQGGTFGFPFPLSPIQTEHAREYSRDLWLNNKWEGQIHPLSWLIEKFKPITAYWHNPKFADILAEVNRKGEEFENKRGLSISEGFKIYKTSEIPTKGIIYYTDNQLKLSIAKAVQKQLTSIGLPITSVSLKPMAFGNNIVVKMKRGYLAYFTQILTALENAKEDIVFFAEHDVLYHPSHFDFTPPEKGKWYYNLNVWKVNADTGKALHYDCKQVSGIAVYRETAIKHYRKRLEMVKAKIHLPEVEFNRFVRAMGFEPGTHNRAERVDDATSGEWKSEFPNVDIRHGGNLSPTRWKKEQFRNQKYTTGWEEGDIASIPGWDKIAF